MPGAFRSVFRRNLAANFVAQVWGVVLNLAFVPVFLRLLGPEQYGLIAFGISLQAVLAVLDLGLATTANREFSRARGGSGAASGPVMLRTLEVIYFAMGAFVAASLILTAPWVADHWLQAESISRETVWHSLALLGLATGLRWPVGAYSGVLLGLEHQVSLNLVMMARSALRTAGAGAVLMLAGGTVEAYFSWLVVVSILEVGATRWLAWRSQPRGGREPARFDRSVLRSFWSFSGELTLVSAFAAVLKQEDKVVIARLAPLAALGYYNVAATLSGGLLLFATPVFTAVFPRLNAMLARGDEAGAAALYHRACGLVAMLVAPAAAALMLFPYPLLAAWTRSPTVAAEAAGPLAVLAFAMLLNSSMQVPYALLLAAGLTRISLWINGLGVAILAPLLFVLVRAYGIVGGGVAWAVFNLGYFIVAPILLHRRVLRGHLRHWLLRDTLPFYALAAVCYGGAAWVGRGQTGGWEPFLLLGGASVLYGLAAMVIRARASVKLLEATVPTHSDSGIYAE
jgi:O-antigen/teichoic acid export membrane protein